MGDLIALADKSLKLLAGVAALVVGKSRLDAAKDIAAVLTNGRDIIAVVTPHEDTIPAGLRAASEARLRSLDGTSEYPPKVLHDAQAHMAEALEQCVPDDAALVDLDLDPERITEAMIEAAVARAPRAEFAIAWRAPGSPSLRYFRTVCAGFFGDLLKDDQVVQKLAPVVWRDLLTTVRGMDRKLDLLVERGETKAAEAGGLLRVAVIQLAKRISRDVPDIDQAMIELDRAVEIAVEVQEAGRHSSNLGDFVDEVLARIAAISAEGRFDDAAAEADTAFERWERDEAERREHAVARA